MNEQQILQWCRRSVDLIKEGGILAFISAEMAFRVSHESKTLTLIDGYDADVYSKTVLYFGKVGYKVVDGRPETTN